MVLGGRTLRGAAAISVRLVMTAVIAVAAGVLSAGIAGAQQPPTPEAAVDTDFRVTWSCLNDRGRIDVQLANLSDSQKTFLIEVGQDQRYRQVNGRALVRVPVTNLRDGEQNLRVLEVVPFDRIPFREPRPDGAVLVDLDVPIGCEQPTVESVTWPEVDVMVACGAGVIAEVRLLNPTATPRSYRIEATTADGGTISSTTTTAAGFGVSFRRLTLPTTSPVTLTVTAPGRGVIDEDTFDASCDRAPTETAHNTLARDAWGTRMSVVRNSADVPVIAFSGRNFDFDLDRVFPTDLRLFTCADAYCRSAAAAPTDVLVGSYEDGWYSPLDLELGPEGYPVILYRYSRFVPGTDFRDNGHGLVFCNDPACSGGDETVTRSSWQDDGYELVRMLSVGTDGRPMMLAWQGDETVLVTCSDRFCSDVDVRPQVVAGAHDGQPDNPWWTRDDTTVVCNDAACSDGAVSVVIDRLPEDIDRLSLLRDGNGHPAFLFRKRFGSLTDRRLQLLRCTDPLCSQDVSTVSIRESVERSDYEQGRSLFLLADGRPAVVGVRGSSSSRSMEPDLWLTTCQDLACNRQATRTLLSEGADWRFFLDVSKDASGRPLILTSRSDTESFWTIDAATCVDAECSDGAPQPQSSAELDLVLSCFRGEGRADAYVRNSGRAPMTVTIADGRLPGQQGEPLLGEQSGEQRIVVEAGDVRAVTLVGLRDGFQSIDAWTTESEAASTHISERATFDCGAGAGDGEAEASGSLATDWATLSGCRDGAGVIELYRVSDSGGSVVLESEALGNRSTTTMSQELARIRLTSVGDGVYPLTIRGTGLVATTVIECAITTVVSCLAERGRVDIFVVNNLGAALAVEVSFGSLVPRTADLPDRDLHRFAITGRPNGPHQLTVVGQTDGGEPRVLRSEVVNVSCGPDGDGNLGSRDAVVWYGLTGCRDGAGVIELFTVNPPRYAFGVFAAGLESRRVQPLDGGLARFVFEGVADGTYALAQGDTGDALAEVTVDCGLDE